MPVEGGDEPELEDTPSEPSSVRWADEDIEDQYIEEQPAFTPKQKTTPTVKA